MLKKRNQKLIEKNISLENNINDLSEALEKSTKLTQEANEECRKLIIEERDILNKLRGLRDINNSTLLNVKEEDKNNKYYQALVQCNKIIKQVIEDYK